MVLAAHFSLLPSQNMNVGNNLSPPAFFPGFPSQFILNFSSLLLTLRLPLLCLPPLFRCPPSPPSQPISASYEVWKMIVCRMKWTEFAGVMAWQNESRPSLPSITGPRQPRLRSVKVLAYWLLVVTTKCLIQCLLHSGRWGGGGVCWWVDVNAGGCSPLKNPLVIDFKWWNIDFCPGQGLAERAAAIYRRQGAGHTVLLASISHSDTGKMREEGSEGERESRKRNKSMASRLALSYMNQNRGWIICI